MSERERERMIWCDDLFHKLLTQIYAAAAPSNYLSFISFISSGLFFSRGHKGFIHHDLQLESQAVSNIINSWCGSGSEDQREQTFFNTIHSVCHTWGCLELILVISVSKMCSSSITFRYSTPVTIIIMMIIMIISETLGYYIPSSSSSTSHGNGYSYSNHKNGYSLNNYPGYSNYNRDYTKGYNSYNTRTSSYPMSSSSDSSYPSSSSPSYLAAVNRDIPSYTRGYSYSSSGNYGNGYSNSPVKDYHKDYSTSSSINYPSYTTSSGSNSGSSTTSSSNSDLISKHYEQDIYALNKGYPNKLNLHLPHMPNINLPQINLPQLPPLNNFYPKRYPTKYPTYTSTKYPAFDPSTATPFLTTSSSLPPLPSTMSSTTPENSPVIVKPHKRPITRRPVIHQYPVASSSLPYFETTSHSSNIYPSNFDPHPTTPPVNDASTGGMGLLYVCE